MFRVERQNLQTSVKKYQLVCFFPQLLVTQIELKLSSEEDAPCTNETSILLIRVFKNKMYNNFTDKVSALSNNSYSEIQPEVFPGLFCITPMKPYGI